LSACVQLPSDRRSREFWDAFVEYWDALCVRRAACGHVGTNFASLVDG